MTDTQKDYAFWRDMLAGKSMAIHVDQPQCGFYRVKNSEARVKASGRAFSAVAIWRADNGEIVALIGSDGKNMRVTDPNKIWLACCMNPVQHAQYTAVVDDGELWPDELTPQPVEPPQPKGTVMPASVPQDDASRHEIGGNRPPEEEVKADLVTAAINAADAELKNPGGLDEKVHFDRLANHRDRLSKLWSELELKRKTEKAPHLKAAAEVDMKYCPDLDRIKLVGEALKAAITKFLLAEQERLKKAQEAAAQQPAQAGKPMEAPKKVETPKVGTTGRKAALRTFTSAKIVDYAKALAACADKPEIVQVVQTLADRAARAGIAIDGCEIVTEEKAV